MRLRLVALFALLACGLSAPDRVQGQILDRVLGQDKKKDDVPVVAHIRLSGDLDEAPPGESLFGSSSNENLKMQLDRIAKAKADPKVKALFLELHGLKLGLFSFGKIHEVRQAVAEFRKSGKKTYAYMEDIGGLDYLIAIACEQVLIPEGGSFGLAGLHIEMSFYKQLFDNVRIKGDFLTMGEAKGAVEPYTRTEMGPENKKQYNLVLDDLYDNALVKTMVESRPAQKWDAPAVKQLIDRGPYSGKKALALGLVDKLVYFSDVEAIIKADLKTETMKVAKDYLKPASQKDESTLSMLMKMLNPPSKKKSSKKDKLAIIYAVGGIESGKGGAGFMGSSVGSDTLVEAIKEADNDPTVKAIVLRVDSPGGSALASDIMWKALKDCKKPVVSSMGDVAASGGYYITMCSKKVFAEPGTLTGSIGVLGGKIVVGGLADMVGVKTETLVRGKNAGSESMFKEFSETEKVAIKAMMQDIYDQFLDKAVAGRVANGVKMTKETLLPLAGGRIWTGRQAKELGLVDELGTLDDAIAEARKLAKVPAGADLEILMLPESGSPLDSLLGGGLGFSMESEIAKFLKASPEARPHFRAAEQLLRMRHDKVWLTMPYGLRVK
jgi:protease IV